MLAQGRGRLHVEVVHRDDAIEPQIAREVAHRRDRFLQRGKVLPLGALGKYFGDRLARPRFAEELLDGEEVYPRAAGMRLANESFAFEVARDDQNIQGLVLQRMFSTP